MASFSYWKHPLNKNNLYKNKHVVTSSHRTTSSSSLQSISLFHQMLSNQKNSTLMLLLPQTDLQTPSSLNQSKSSKFQTQSEGQNQVQPAALVRDDLPAEGVSVWIGLEYNIWDEGFYEGICGGHSLRFVFRVVCCRIQGFARLGYMLFLIGAQRKNAELGFEMQGG